MVKPCFLYLLTIACVIYGVESSCSVSTDKFTSLSSWTPTNGWSWGESYFSTSQSTYGSSGLTLNMTTSGCPSGCGGVSTKSGAVTSKTTYQYGIINITAKTSPYGNFRFNWESSSPSSDGVEFTIYGENLEIEGYTQGTYSWYGGYPLGFTPSVGYHVYTISRTASSILLFIDGHLRTNLNVGPIPTSAGSFSMIFQDDDTLPVTSTSVIIQSFSYSSSGCAIGGTGTSNYDGVHIPAAPTGPAVPTGGWKVVAADSFNTRTLSSLWASGLLFGSNSSEGANGPASGTYLETEWFQPSNLILGDGNLRLTVKKETVTHTISGQSYSFPYTSGAIRGWPGTSGGFAFNFHTARTVVEWRAKMPPAGPGSWSALWFLSNNGVWPPEIDQMEMFGSSSEPTSHVHLTFNGDNIGPGFADSSGTDYSTGFHLWTMDMQSTGIYVYIDGMLQGSFTDSSNLNAIQNDGLAMNNHFWYAIANVAIQTGETPVGLPFDMAIDYFVAYQPSNSPSSAIQGGGLAPNTTVAGTTTTATTSGQTTTSTTGQSTTSTTGQSTTSATSQSTTVKSTTSTTGQSTTSAAGQSTTSATSQSTTVKSTTSSTTTGSTTGSTCAVVDNFASINPSTWAVTNGWGWGASFFTSAETSTNSNGLLLSMTKNGCPSACGGSALQAGRIETVSAFATGTYQIVIKAETYANFQIGWESASPRDGVELTLTGNTLAVAYYTSGTYHWVNQYTLSFTPSANYYKYTITRTSSQVTIYANGAQISSFAHTSQFAGTLSMALQSDSTISVTTTSASVRSVSFYPVGCSFSF